MTVIGHIMEMTRIYYRHAVCKTAAYVYVNPCVNNVFKDVGIDKICYAERVVYRAEVRLMKRLKYVICSCTDFYKFRHHVAYRGMEILILLYFAESCGKRHV